jgi:ABC-type multidrug transport system fused ATPase/permease subunit
MSLDPTKFYLQQISELEHKIKLIKQRLFLFSMLRLSVFLLTAFAAYFAWGNPQFVFFIIVAGLALFLGFVSKNEDIKNTRKKNEKLLALNQLEMRVASRDFEGLATGDEYISDTHPFNQDIDLFGKGSLFQLINRTATHQGKNHLASILNANKFEHIIQKQRAFKELATKAIWRQEFYASAALIQTSISSSEIIGWLKKYSSELPKIFSFFPNVFGFMSVVLMVLYGFSLVPFNALVLPFFLGLLVTGIYLKKINTLYLATSKMTETFRQYGQLLSMIEAEEFKAQLLNEKQERIKEKGIRASNVLKALTKDLNSLDQRNNIFFALLANGFFLWDIRYAKRIENWISTYRTTVERWFDVIEQFDADNSLANFVFNHPSYVYPTIDPKSDKVIKAIGLGHPLLTAKHRVDNDFDITKNGFIIITGANMAGKSTFLRALAVNIVLANIGLTVCAKSFDYAPIKLISSMRTTDSLQNDESYFFSELKRLKYIVDTLKEEPYFVILDEILKGTNSKDKAEGSAKFIVKLLSTQSTGVIATHDLSLCVLSEEYKQVENKYFDAEIKNDELYFDYKFKDGVCQNMNASFLLKKMEIV